MAAMIGNKFKLGLTICVLSSLYQCSWSQNSTTLTVDNTTLDNSNTTTATTTVPTTTATTTTIAPSVPGTTIPAQTDVSKCPCDLTGNACDVGCCCDPDCTSADKAAFGPCLPYSYELDDKLCFDKDVFFLENGPARSGDSGGLFCIYYDNDAQRNYYTNPSLVTTEAEFLKYTAKYRKFSFQSSAPSTSVRDFSQFYKSGDPIYVVFQNEAFSFLALPSAISSSSVCTDSNPAAYLTDQSNVCARMFSSLATDCASHPALKASTFYEGFRIIKDTFLLQAYNASSTGQHPVLGSVDLTDVKSLYNNSYTVAFVLDPIRPLQCIKNGMTGPCSFATPPSAPTYANNVCANALVEVHYRFLTNGTLGIDTAFVSFVFKDLDSPSVTQTFSATFSLSNSSTSERVQRSGNPGYQIGKPVIAGVFNISTQGTTTEEIILLTQDRGQQLALVRPSLSGDCMTDAGLLREPVIFGQDMRTGCFIQVTSATETSFCQLLQQAIINAIEGYEVPTYDSRFSTYPKNNRFVAMFGDSDVRRTGDWVEIFFKNRPGPPQSGSQCLLSLGANIQILYANVGSLPNPQAKIIGVAYVYDAPQEVKYKCTGNFCQPGSATVSQKIEISSSVTFIDVSQPPVAVEGVYPTFAARLPYDFFYPFLNSAPKSQQMGCLCWFLCLVCVIVTVFNRHYMQM